MPSRRAERAARVWAAMQEFVDAHEASAEARMAAGLGRGKGRPRVLLVLRDGPLTLGAIAKLLGIDPPYATLIVDKLERRGMVERRPDPDDLRRRLVVLTDPGREAVATAEAVLRRPPPPLAQLGEEELAELERLLGRLDARDPGA